MAQTNDLRAQLILTPLAVGNGALCPLWVRSGHQVNRLEQRGAGHHANRSPGGCHPDGTGGEARRSLGAVVRSGAFERGDHGGPAAKRPCPCRQATDGAHHDREPQTVKVREPPHQCGTKGQ